MEDSPESEDFPGRLLHQVRIWLIKSQKSLQHFFSRFQAALWDNEDLLVDLLQEQTTLIESVDSWGRSPIHAAAITKNSKCLPLLINAGANVNSQCGLKADNKTALHISAEYGHGQNVDVLLAAGASHTVRDSNGFTAFDLAEKSGHREIVEMLKRAAGWCISVFGSLGMWVIVEGELRNVGSEEGSETWNSACA